MEKENNKFVVKFDYNIEQLQLVAKEVEELDLSNLDLVKETHKKIVKIRTTIKKQEKEMVDEANEFRNAVFDKRNEYLEITEPLESKLKAVLDAEEKKKIIEARKILLPMRKQQLSMLEILLPSDEELLEMDEEQWVEFYTARVEDNKRILAIKAREDQIREEMKVKAEKEKEELLKKAEADKIKAVEDEKARVALAEKRKKEEQEKAELEAERAKEKLESNRKYQAFLSVNNYDEKTDIIINNNGAVKLYRFVAEHNL